MDIIQSLILGAVQGITEFLPVSSSGHLVLLQKIFNFREAPVFFDTMVHGATLLAVIFYLKKDIFEILKNIPQNKKIIWLLIAGTVPSVLFGLFFKKVIEQSFDSLWMLSVGFFITAIILFLTRFIKKEGRVLEKTTLKDSLVIGISQAISILPSISRSGATISSGIFMGLSRNAAFRFSFLLSIPAIAGAMVLQIFDINSVSQNEILASFFGFIPAMIFGFFSLKLLDKYMANEKFSSFAYYCIFLSVISLFLI